MGKKVAGYLIVALSGLLFGVEFYTLKFLYIAEYGAHTPYLRGSPVEGSPPLAYLGEPVVLISFLITASVFIFGLCLAVKKKDNQSSAVKIHRDF